MIIRRVEISKLVGMRYDVSFYQERFDYSSQIYPTYELGDILYINPSVTFSELTDNDVISYVPMEAIDERYGIISLAKNITVANTKGYTKFKEGDLLWAKITPCMQNGKSAIAQNLLKGVGCGSTEFFVLRPKSSNVLIKYIHFILRDYRVLKSAQNSFGGSAGQQRVSSSYLKTIRIPLPPIEIQQKLVDIYTAAQNAKLQKDKEAKELLESIDDYLLEALSINPSQEVSSESVFTKRISEMIGNRLDVSFYKDRFEMVSRIYPNKRLSSIVDIDPTIRFTGLADDTPISFIPMECIDDTFGEVKEQRETTIAQTKGYTKFEENDLLWAKITPCMQNGKSAIARNLTNGVGCGSTEYYVIRPKTNDLIIDYVYLVLRHHAVLKAAQNSFGGSAGQQRVSSQYVKSIVIPHPPIDVQKSIIATVIQKKERAKQLQSKGSKVLEEAKATIEKMILG
ncbi:restriction endonuclease subunit S [Alistipes communis]|jgi:type I restriction-modification system (specificity subunit)|uniref:restriction endonuclease subunit S n=1 Tax=Alistipes communis TaxID=2585118 RepID=UPI0022E403A5|nr:restriction endonuclease subunit S [Alistipes communis]